ncbi:MAG: hypothetical protein ACKOQZ_05355, partial [Actinomycetota bacterium]
MSIVARSHVMVDARLPSRRDAHVSVAVAPPFQDIVVSTASSTPVDPQHRLFDSAKGGGAMRDVGIYPLTLAWWFLGKPDAWSARGTIGSTGVDEAVETTMSWNGGATATLTCASRREGTRAST